MPTPALLSDIGNVLAFFDFSIAAQRVAARCPYPASALSSRLDHIKLPFENGDMDDATFLREAVAALEFQGSEDDFARIWCEIFTENTAMRQALEPLAGSVPMYLLSNTSGLHKEHLVREIPVLSLFQDGIYSYSAKCSKPGEEIFLHTLERLQLDPALTLFVDDLAPNIATAQRLGFETHHYHHDRHEAFLSALAEWRAKHDL